MKLAVVVVFGIACAARAAYAQEPVQPDVEILSVVPRGPDVRPYVFAVPAEGRPRPSSVAEKQSAAKPISRKVETAAQTKVAQDE